MIGDAIGAADAGCDLVDHRVTIAPLVRALPPREREVLHLRFDDDMTQTQIAARIGCSQMQVSRILRRALTTLSHAGDEPQRPARLATGRADASEPTTQRA
ncbi:sigma-70 family RNA polymerase sigma factor [Conexibacter sp. JD483]|uniref:sigma-70 family RNA polymerase sigma factor n=1 Tax=unclassified Conexibacter TaxID=2627773 RepID=UPI0027275506|nr:MULTISPECIES: sigma-70 family RNA polymerase sigma factor [unclassified Conexibacter]MDO8188610.1 sigma-70 family RNA polymerase sigma factor [Conexibacter sp. CPCC 205706]MDO8201500.1 sigma-70 family RNA polymerase sigma factor [Conexibacter sp. CPCC 205762]MDR9370867.1 sigma-70 family RNA polymerase sigma factor [Conexibacter sp. JD483]